MNCIFCKIINKDMSSEIVYEDDQSLVIKDINPKAKFHLLIISKEHFSSLNEVTEDKAILLGKLMLRAKTIARDLGFDKSGYRIVINTGKDSGQLVDHLHIHLLGGGRVGVGL